MGDGESTSDAAWLAAKAEAQVWLDRLGDRDYGRTSREFAAWLEAAPINTVAFTAVCAESLQRLPVPR